MDCEDSRICITSLRVLPQLLEILGKGASSVVQKARNMRTGVVMALKIINVFDKEKRHQLMKEIRTLHQVQICHTPGSRYEC